MASKDWPRSTRPVIMGTRHMVSAGHYLAAAAGSRILEAGGNAVDAGVAAGLCINVTQADLTNIGGVAPLMMYLADSGTVETISGLGWWPKAATIDFFQRQQGGRIRRGVNRCVLPSAIDAWLTALERHGTMTFADVAAPAIELADDGFPMYDVMRDILSTPSALEGMRQWPSTRSVFLPDWPSGPAWCTGGAEGPRPDAAPAGGGRERGDEPCGRYSGSPRSLLYRRHRRAHGALYAASRAAG